MAEDDTWKAVDPQLVTRIVSSYVRRHRLTGDELAAAISTIHQTLAGLGRVVASAPAPERVPAVPVRRSVHNDYLVCLECGFRAQMLRRHLKAMHNLDPATYRARWKLRADYPVTAPAYSQQRSSMAKQLGLGRRPTVSETSGSPPSSAPAALDPVFVASLSQPTPRRGRRRRSALPA
jgi:predicted transcriptional regulator